MNRSRMILLLSATILASLGLAACGGGDDDDPGFTPGAVVCDKLLDSSYKYTARVHFIVDPAPTPVPGGTGGPGRTAADIAQEVSGAIQDADSYQADMAFIDQGFSTETHAVQHDGQAWLNSSGGGWTDQTSTNPDRPTRLVPYLPVNLCDSIAPDVDASTQDHASEKVGDLASERFDYAPLVSDFPDRSPDFGPGSDVAGLINEFDGSVWVAHDGNFISKLLMSGQGAYSDGSILHVEITYEITDWDADVDVQLPF